MSLNRIAIVLGAVLCIAGLSLAESATTVGQSSGEFTSVSDIGTSLGTSTFDAGEQTYTLGSSDKSLQGATDSLRFLWKQVEGDGSLIARVLAPAGATDSGEAGLMIRQSQNGDSPFFAVTAGAGEVAVTRRSNAGELAVRAVTHAFKAPIWLKLTREGDNVSAWLANVAGTPQASDWKRIGEPRTLNLTARAMVGLFATGQGGSAKMALSYVSWNKSGETAAAISPSAGAKPIHAYRFADGAVRDMVRSAHGTISATARIAEGKLILNNPRQASRDPDVAFAKFAARLLPSSGDATIMVWFTTRNSKAWARILDIGSQERDFGDKYLFILPRDGGDGLASVTFSPGGGRAHEAIITAPPLDDGKPHMMCVVINSNTRIMQLFVDGTPAGTPVSVPQDMLSGLPANNQWLGRSQYLADPAFSGSIDGFQIYDTALTPEQIADAYRQGPAK